jgi:translation initiation factor IF-1
MNEKSMSKLNRSVLSVLSFSSLCCSFGSRAAFTPFRPFVSFRGNFGEHENKMVLGMRYAYSGNSPSTTSEGKQKKKQKKLVEMDGLVTHNLSNGKFRLKLENGVEVIGHLSGKIRQNRIKIVVGDKVTIELSPYDLTKGRITYRYR